MHKFVFAKQQPRPVASDELAQLFLRQLAAQCACHFAMGWDFFFALVLLVWTVVGLPRFVFCWKVLHESFVQRSLFYSARFQPPLSYQSQSSYNHRFLRLMIRILGRLRRT